MRRYDRSVSCAIVSKLVCPSLLLATKENSSYHRILQFVSSVTNSRLGSYLQALSDQEQSEYGHRYLCDFLLLSFQIKSEDELKVQINKLHFSWIFHMQV